MNHSHLNTQDIDGSFTLLQDTFRQVRPLILSRAGQAGESRDKHDGSPVTDTDVEVEHIIQAAMTKHFPNVPVFGEEGGYTDDLDGAFWLVDPIDGTKSFIENIPGFTSMAVLVQDDEAVASIIYNTSTGDMYTAQKGKGAFKNDVRLDLGAVQLPAVAICKGRFNEELDKILQPHGVTCQTGLGGGGYDFTLVAEGTIAVRFNLLGRGYIHDYAPGALLVSEAGGAIIPFQDDAYTYKTRSFAACHPALGETVRKHRQAIRELELELSDKP